MNQIKLMTDVASSGSMANFVPYKSGPADNSATYRRFFFISSNLTITEVDMTRLRYVLIQIEQKYRIGYCEVNSNSISVFQLKNAIGDMNAQVFIDLDENIEKIRAFCMKEEGRVSGPYEYGTLAKRGRKPNSELAIPRQRLDQIVFSDISSPAEITASREAQLCNYGERHFKTEVYYVWGDIDHASDYVKEASGYNADHNSVSVITFQKSRDKIQIDGYNNTDVVILPNINMGDIKYTYLCNLCGDLPMKVVTGFRKLVNWAPKQIWFYHTIPPKDLVPSKEDFNTFQILITQEYHMIRGEAKEIDQDDLWKTYVCMCERDGRKCNQATTKPYTACTSCARWMKEHKTLLRHRCKNYERCNARVAEGEPLTVLYCILCQEKHEEYKNRVPMLSRPKPEHVKKI
jgi:hypothetical protein